MISMIRLAQLSPWSIGLGLGLGLAAFPAFADPCIAPLPRPGVKFSGVVRYVGDGDSLCVGATADPETWIEVRIADFYAPELNAPGGKAAKAALSRIARGKHAQCVAGRRSYDRVVAKCYLRGRSLGASMRAAGVREGGNGR
jgi:endonuclease YncB( thermonuclease family)